MGIKSILLNKQAIEIYGCKLIMTVTPSFENMDYLSEEVFRNNGKISAQ